MAGVSFMERPPHLPPVSDRSLEPSSAIISKHPNKPILKLLNTKCTLSLPNLKQAHALILKTNQIKDHYVAGTLLKCYAIPHFNALNSSFQIFNQVPNPNVFIFNALIKGCLDNNRLNKALSLYQSMVSLNANMNKFTYPNLFKACSDLQAVKEGLQIHAHVVKRGFGGDGHVKSAGIHMYASFGQPDDARNLLYGGGKLDIVCLNAMIDGYMKCGDVEAAKDLFSHTGEKNVETWNAIISGLVKCGMIEDARKMFDEMPERDVVSYGAMIDGYNNKGDQWKKEAMEISLMMHENQQLVEMNEYVLSCSITACANIGALDHGKQVHDYIKTNSIPINALIGNSLIDMYAQCGQIELALSVFESIKSKGLSSWNAMISGLALHGQAEDTVRLLSKMHRLKVNPNHTTFVNILNSFLNDERSVQKGMKYLKYMKSIYGVEPNEDHYVCVVNLLGKAGMITGAEEFINSMPIKPNFKVWGALLNSCLVHGNLELGDKIGRMLVELEPENRSWYILLTKIHAKGGKPEEVEKLREVMKETKIGRSSMIYVNGEVHVFETGENLNPKMKEIEGKMVEKLKLDSGLFDDDNSERLAIAFGLVGMTKGDETIHVVNNRRICDDSHFVVKAISRVYQREIIVRDPVSYHKFVNGSCSCNEFW